jgi:hypothetical protein
VAVIGLLLVAGGCDDALELDDEDKRVALGAFPRNVCPEPGGTGESLLVATVYGVDGNVLDDVTVRFESTAGTVEPEKSQTNRRGLARSTLTVGFTADLTATAMVSEVGEDTAALQAPSPARIAGAPDQSTYEMDPAVDDEVAFTVALLQACHAKTISFVLGFDPQYLAYAGNTDPTASEAFAFEDGQPVDVTITDVAGANAVQVTVERDPAGDLDFTGSGAMVTLYFDAIAETPLEPEILDAEFTLTGTTIQDELGTFYPVEELDPIGVQIIAATAF